MRRVSFGSAPSGTRKTWVIGVSMLPGQIALARRPCFAYSTAMPAVSAITPPFEAP